eukprot:CAMPEP_0181183644 /NCGR_PEP_ID=MMETSP1096-20121128/8535_1 /TAXON_ID=156174 ORGANISM="Chrysochromulina ericina, Strain CCMP281" /NCGR_SAMPLE_ID=MMETSP1096 /ASSEMBLY_ACC=CAM_ASM_000453 /LENGTH=324 /DNA_ID=CAMNT_0023272337 /DNA_START=18 /DNA_END=992 /DNA_ORIENTATION=-
MALPWIEKYRPKSVDDVSHQEEVVDSLRHIIEQKNLPHLIFYGPPGTGKTSTILAAARQLFGSDYRQRVMELNASDERGIAVVRNKIKTFAQVAVSSQTGPNTPPPYKLIVLDEADSMTTDAQSALRRTMETYSRVTRFCIICNYISRLIPPIASRCAKFRFKALPHSAMVERLQFIADKEGVCCPKETLLQLTHQSEGDMRRAIQMLQSLHQLYGGDLRPSCVLDISGAVPEDRLGLIFDTCRKNDLDRTQVLVNDFLADGYPVSQLITQMLEFMLKPETGFNSVQISKVAMQLAEVDKQLIDGADDYVQLMNLLAFCMRQLK